MNAPPSRLAPGLHLAYPEADYHTKELGMVSKGALDRVLRSPAHYLAWVDGIEEPDAPPFRFGRALHMRTLEPARFAATYLLEPAFGPCRKTDACTSEAAKENKTRRDAWRLEHAGATILDGETGAATLGMIESIANHPLARPLLEGGEAEMTLRWECPDTGLACKARPDFFREDIHTPIDLKSAADASPDAFARSVANFGYNRQEAHYTSGFEALEEPVDHFPFIVVEKAAPYAVAVYVLDEEAITQGRKQIYAAKRVLAECLESGRWPGYPDRIQRLSLPRWALKEGVDE